MIDYDRETRGSRGIDQPYATKREDSRPYVIELRRRFDRAGLIEVFYSNTDVSDAPSFETQTGACRARAKPRNVAHMEVMDEPEDLSPKAKNANLSNRLPREDFAIIIPFDDRAPLMERCKDVLGDRMKENRLGYFLDGKPANTDKIVRAAGLKYADEEEVMRSPPTRRRKRRRPTPKT